MIGDPDLDPTEEAARDGRGDPGWLRYVIPGLAILAVVAGAVALWSAARMRELQVAAGPTPVVVRLGEEERDASPFKGFVMRPERPAPDFELTDAGGQPWRLTEAQDDEAVALFFGFSHCPDICPQTLAILSQTMEQLGPAADDFKVVVITVDPARDTPAVFGDYVTAFDSRFVALTGEEEAIREVASAYGVHFAREVPPAAATQAAELASGHAPAAATGEAHAEGDAHGHDQAGTASGSEPAHGDDVSVEFNAGSAAYSVAHSGTVFLIDPQGQLRSSFLGLFAPDEVAHDVRLLLDERDG
jgi:protein SCO1/2